MIFVLAPILFAIGFILNLYLGNSTELHLSALWAPVVAFSFFALLISLVFNLVFKSRVRGAVMASVLMVVFFAFGNQPIVGLAVIGAALVWIFRTKKNLVSIAKFGLVTAIIFVAIAGVRVLGEEKQKADSAIKSPLVIPRGVVPGDGPDIYYIVPDSYSSSTSLLKYYGFDNSQFEKSLTEKGFYVASESASNYPKTFLSLGSSLNLEYLDYLSKNKNSKNLSIVDPLIEDNNAVKFLKSQGYTYYHLGSWWGATKTNRNADYNVILENESPLPISQFGYVVLKSTLLEPVLDRLLAKLTVGDSDRDRMNRADYQFEQLTTLASKSGPKFVFAHIIAPHEPYYYDRNCEYVSFAERKKIKEKVKYINHLVCINKKLEQAVNGILANSKKPPVIIIQSDEGAPFLAEELEPHDGWGKASDEFLKEKFFVFSAYYLPGASEDKLYSTITPVNSFRLVFNEYLGTNFPMLPDKSYIMPDLKHLYDFVDITEKIK